MQRNRYTPPSTPVADIAVASVTPNREVLLACHLFWISFGLSIVGSASDLLKLSGSGLRIGVLVGAMIGCAIGFALTSWTVWKLKAGRNWMRLLVTLVSVLGYICIAVFWKFYSPIYAGNPIAAGVSVLEAILDIWAIVLINVPDSRAWFSAKKSSEQGAA
jgi:hypothetical protein